MKYSNYNIVIVGSGISGLFLANKLARNNNFKDGILIITKDELFSGSSSLAQGGIVSVMPKINPNDSVELHIKDTMKAGCNLNNINSVKFVSTNSSLAIEDLIKFGVEFDKNENGTFNFTMEGAHSIARILHSKGDSTGSVIEKVLVEQIKNAPNVDVYENTMALELLTDGNNICKGLIAYNTLDKTYEAVYASCVVLATGGIGQIYSYTTNPEVSTGDGIAIAYNSGAKVSDMEFVQFHPTSLYCKDKFTVPLVSESVRGEGASLIDINGKSFVKDYDERGDLAPRDVVARAIFNQMEITNSPFVNLDISSIGLEKFKKRFPTITKLCLENDIDLTTNLIPVRPCEHYFMGGIKVDIHSKTTIENLYAIGECAATGLHGANRLASNSLLECTVYPGELAKILNKEAIIPPKKNDVKIKNIIENYINVENNSTDYETIEYLKDEFKRLKKIMSENVGIIRTKESLRDALYKINELEFNLDGKKIYCKEKYELKNAITVSKLIIRAALKREISIGAHYRLDNKTFKEKSNDKTLAQ